MNKKEVILKKFGKPSVMRFGTCGWPMPMIAKELSAQYGSKHIKINVPYHTFNCKGTANRIAKEVIGRMPFSEKPIKEGFKTFFYGDEMANNTNYIPFLSKYDVYWVDSIGMENKEIVINLSKAPNYTEYL